MKSLQKDIQENTSTNIDTVDDVRRSVVIKEKTERLKDLKKDNGYSKTTLSKEYKEQCICDICTCG